MIGRPGLIFTGLDCSLEAIARRSLAAARGDALNPNPLRVASYGTLPHCRMSHSSRGVGLAPGGSGEMYRGSDVEMTPMAPPFVHRPAPQLADVGVAEHHRAFQVLAGVVFVAIAAADVEERREDAAGRRRERVDAEREPILLPRQHDLVLARVDDDRAIASVPTV